MKRKRRHLTAEFKAGVATEAIKEEKLRLWSYVTIRELRGLVTDWMEFYNHRSKHQALDYATPWSLYSPPKQMAALEAGGVRS